MCRPENKKPEHDEDDPLSLRLNLDKSGGGGTCRFFSWPHPREEGGVEVGMANSSIFFSFLLVLSSRTQTGGLFAPPLEEQSREDEDGKADASPQLDPSSRHAIRR